MAEQSLPGSPPAAKQASIPSVKATAVDSSSLTGWNALRVAINRTFAGDLAAATSLQAQTARLLSGQ